MPQPFAIATATQVLSRRGQADLTPAPDAALGGCVMLVYGRYLSRSTGQPLPAVRSSATGLSGLNAQGIDGAAQTAAACFSAKKANPASLWVDDLTALTRAAG